MTGILALLVGSAVVGLHGHRPLMWLADRRVDPTVVLTGWLLTTVGLVASAVATISLLALPADEHHSSGIFRLAGGCWTAISSGSVPRWREALGALSVLGATAILLRLAWATNRRIGRLRAQAPHVAQLRLLAGRADPEEPLWVRDDRPLAMSIGGRPGLIVMSDSLRDRLSPEALAAALEHERAHLRGRHHALIAVAEIFATALPICPLLRAAPNAIKDLVELAADAQAARRCGSDAVREALSRLTGQAAPALGLGMAGRLTQARLSRLGTGKPAGHRGLRLVGCVAISLGALMLPAAAGWLALNMVGCVVT
ncbi:M56 family metallopeptidase [Blastococcus sp. CT_GayMR16]|uniref:M56 family metallopeptidase n=1 Tax=Blastococcus sp. CT_GayMR16 TaxID=2559607 RepID=UPI0010737D10|nr:M56 family metallopeptidase [Blastococcus sp. CT_GayMR16]TFV91131.1 M56 family peptidase [Blastococcus sp. CT_GayMR16]